MLESSTLAVTSLETAGTVHPPTVSVVMSVYNGARYLRESVESILSQEGVDIEFVIVDDGSTDESPTILDAYAARDSRVRILRQQNTGLTRALIRGCAAARGEFIARQDADDVSLSGRLASLTRLLRSNPALAFVSSSSEVVGPDGDYLLTHRRPPGVSEAMRLLSEERIGPPGHGSVMFRRSVYDAVGGYRSEFVFAQDCDLWFRLAEHGLFEYRPEVLYRYRIAADSISGSCNPIKLEFARRVDLCRKQRQQGHSEEPILAECRSLTGFRSRNSASDQAATWYFLGRNLMVRNPTSAAGCFRACLRLVPWHIRAWFGLAVVAVLRLSNVFNGSRRWKDPKYSD